MSAPLLFLHPPRNERTAAFLSIPVGAFGVVNNLRRNGYAVRGYNIPLEMQCGSGFSIEQAMRTHRPAAALIDLHWYEHASGAVETARSVKRFDPSCLVVLGGLTATIFAKQLIAEHQCVDVVIRGEGEVPSVRLFDSIFKGTEPLHRVPGLTYRHAGGLAQTPLGFWKHAESTFDYVDFSWLHNSDRYLHSTPTGMNSPYRNFWLMIATGCLYNCTYCGGGRDALERSFGRTRVWRREPAEVAHDFLRLLKAGVEIINPSHDLSMFGRGFWVPLFDFLRSARRRPGIYLELFQLPSPEFLERFAQAVTARISTLVFSPLVGDEALRRRHGKLYSNEALLERLRLCRQLRLRAQLGFSENLPGTDGTIRRSQAELLARAELVYPGIEHYSQEITLDPHSRMAVDPQAHGILRRFRRLADYIAYTSGDASSPRRNGYDLLEDFAWPETRSASNSPSLEADSTVRRAPAGIQ